MRRAEYERKAEMTAAKPYGQVSLQSRKQGLLQRFWNWLMYTESQNTPVMAADTVSPERRNQIREALRDWQAATAYFENVTDPTLVDYAVFDMEAAQKRYMYLLKGARK